MKSIPKQSGIFLFIFFFINIFITGLELDLYFSGSFLTNFHIRNIYYNFGNIDGFNYYYRFDKADDQFLQNGPVYNTFSSDRLNKAQYSFNISISPSSKNYFVSLEYSIIYGNSEFPILGGSLFKHNSTNDAQYILFLEKDRWRYKRTNTGMSFKNLIRDLGSFRLYYVFGLDMLDLKVDIDRYDHIICGNAVSSSIDSHNRNYTRFGINAFIESSYMIYQNINLFIKLGYKHYQKILIEIPGKFPFQDSAVYFNPGSISFQFGIIYKFSRI